MTVYYRIPDSRLVLNFIGIKLTFPIKSYGWTDFRWTKFYKKLNKKRFNTNKILFWGDSIINLSCVEKILNVLNLGIGGETLANAIKQLIKFDKLKDKKLIFAYGINDIIAGNQNSIIENYETLIEYFSKNSIVYVASILPINSEILLESRGLEINNNEIFEINKNLEKICSEKDNTFFINTTKNMYDETLNLKKDYTTDGVHLSKQGYQLFYNNLIEYFGNYKVGVF